MGGRIARILLCAGAGVLIGAVPASATNYSYIKKGTYAGSGNPFSTSFRVTSKTRKGPRTLRSFKLGPAQLQCVDQTQTPFRYKQLPLPRLSGFPPVTIPNGFVVRSYVQRGSHWKTTVSGTHYSGLLPHVDFSLVYFRPAPRFNPNPLARPSVSYSARFNEAGAVSTAGPWACSVGGPVVFRKR
jgi:hypothetical protein